MTDTIPMQQLAQPPTFTLDLLDGATMVGWLTPHAVGFRGFADEAEAMHAAWMAHRTLARRMARLEGRRPIPVDTEPLALKADDSVFASNERIATLVRPGVTPGSDDSFGFELALAGPMEEVRARAKAHLLYRTLRRSGLRWGMWREMAAR
jgi:hypothetical protein